MARVNDRHLHVVDPWGGVDSSDQYDAEAFYVRSVNKHDHTAQTRVSVHPDTYAEITNLLASGDLGGTPINSYAAFVRDALVHNMHRIGTLLNNPRMVEFAAMQRMLASIDQMDAGVELLRKMVGEADGRLEAATRANDVEHVEQLIEKYEPMVDQIRDPYATQLETALKGARSWLKMKSKL